MALKYIILNKNKGKSIGNILGMVKIENKGMNVHIIEIPNKKKKWIIKKIKKQIQDDDVIMLSNDLQEYKKYIPNKNIKKVQIKPYLLEDIIKFIIKNNKSNLKLEMQDLYFLCKECNIKIIEMLEFFLRRVRTINIIAENISAYQKCIEKYPEEEAMNITISNNYRKSLKRAKWVINVDMKLEEIKRYTLRRDGIFIQLQDEKILGLLGFEGIIIDDVEIDIAEEIKERYKKWGIGEMFCVKDLYESDWTCETTYYENVQKMKKEQVILKNLIGINGIIEKEEFKNTKISLTNTKN